MKNDSLSSTPSFNVQIKITPRVLLCVRVDHVHVSFLSGWDRVSLKRQQPCARCGRTHVIGQKSRTLYSISPDFLSFVNPQWLEWCSCTVLAYTYISIVRQTNVCHQNKEKQTMPWKKNLKTVLLSHWNKEWLFTFYLTVMPGSSLKLLK